MCISGATGIIKRYALQNYTPSFADLISAYAVSGKTNIVSDVTQADTIITFRADDYLQRTDLRQNVDIISTNDVERISAEFMNPLQASDRLDTEPITYTTDDITNDDSYDDPGNL